ncbi:MAG: D-alanyl-D-alanine carboxypeptidase [Gammaproteobacteria bacterium]|jgi:D-alanyl-D-alanine carboxypeptidase (penicillin-binding protein 5/6)|nr:D-alanyl-D-alanine carboxypeptidase [Gammaproteobacteria bacterium]
MLALNFRSLFARLSVLVVFLCWVAVPIQAQVPSAPKVDASAYILVDQANGRVLASERANDRVEPASITKLMTGYLAFRALADGRLSLDEPVTISERAWRAEGSRTFLRVGSQVPVEVLLRGMIIQSGNDAAIALAEHLGGSEATFAELMTREAKRLGMRNSRFRNATGLPDADHYTTPSDIALLSRAMIREFPQYYSWYSEREFVWNNIRQRNRNGLLSKDSSVDGIKTGHTSSAGYCLASSALRGQTRLIAAVFGSPSVTSREQASASLLNYGFTFYETVTLRKAGEKILEPRLYKGAEQFLVITPARNVDVTIPRGSARNLRVSTQLDEPLMAPVEVGQKLGELRVMQGDQVIARAALVSADSVEAGGVWPQIRDTVALMMR